MNSNPNKLIQCDFCNSRDVQFRYRAASFDLLVVMQQKGGGQHSFPWGSIGDWTACEFCSGLIEAGKWDELAQHSTDTNPSLKILNELLIAGEVKQAVLKLHQEFQKNRQGERQPA